MEASEKEKRPIMTRDELRQDITMARSERYYRMAYFVQSKWFMIGGGLAIAIFLLLVYLIA